MFNNNKIDYQKLSTFCGHGKSKIYNQIKKIKNSVSDEARQKNQLQLDSLIIGGLAMYAGYTVERMKQIALTRPTLIIMCGLPNVGKSTEVKKFIKDGYKVLSFDNKIMELFDKVNYNNAYSEYITLNEDQKSIIRLELDNQYRGWLLKGENIVVDFTNITKEVVENWLSPIPNNYKKKAIVLDTDFETILERNKDRENKFIPVEVLEGMRDTFKKSLEDDYLGTLFDVVYYK